MCVPFGVDSQALESICLIMRMIRPTVVICSRAAVRREGAPARSGLARLFHSLEALAGGTAEFAHTPNVCVSPRLFL